MKHTSIVLFLAVLVGCDVPTSHPVPCDAPAYDACLEVVTHLPRVDCASDRYCGNALVVDSSTYEECLIACDTQAAAFEQSSAWHVTQACETVYPTCVG